MVRRDLAHDVVLDVCFLLALAALLPQAGRVPAAGQLFDRLELDGLRLRDDVVQLPHHVVQVLGELRLVLDHHQRLPLSGPRQPAYNG